MASAAVALVLALSHRLRERDRAFHEGDWSERRFLPKGSGLPGRTLGVIGYGRIGREVVRLLAPWRMRVVVTHRTPVDETGIAYATLEELLAGSDVVVITCPLTDETRGMLDARGACR
jgi:D-3-phosphoglycerate dehydrogenase